MGTPAVSSADATSARNATGVTSPGTAPNSATGATTASRSRLQTQGLPAVVSFSNEVNLLRSGIGLLIMLMYFPGAR